MAYPYRNRPRSSPARPGVFARLAVLAFASMLPGASAWADRSAEPGPAEIASAIDRGNVTGQEGVVSWYGAQFQDRKTASGERFDAAAMTMAHRSLPFGTQVKVTNLRNGRSVVVRVNDRGPFVGKRIADLSQAAAAEIGMMHRGVARARIEVLVEETGGAAGGEFNSAP